MQLGYSAIAEITTYCGCESLLIWLGNCSDLALFKIAGQGNSTVKAMCEKSVLQPTSQPHGEMIEVCF